eukprot:TRINITY_DN281_c0_g1_i1.p1 TRINITY_DN281_c0_g1~~TRINITY_DN281_c0_g1_i1.p1  ORF type:complete len:483 (-),score=135.16 TRINITY_DN281_c0_g1_i1:15-1463(-)
MSIPDTRERLGSYLRYVTETTQRNQEEDDDKEVIKPRGFIQIIQPEMMNFELKYCNILDRDRNTVVTNQFFNKMLNIQKKYRNKPIENGTGETYQFTKIEDVGSNEAYVIGRICLNPEIFEMEVRPLRLTVESFLFEGLNPNGIRYQMDLSAIGNYHLFAGEIVILKVNKFNDIFKVSEIISDFRAPNIHEISEIHSLEQLRSFNLPVEDDGEPYFLAGQHFEICQLCGPFKDDFSDLKAALKSICNLKTQPITWPDLIIVHGPMTKSNDIEYSIRDIISEIPNFEGGPARILFQPGINDSVFNNIAFPTFNTIPSYYSERDFIQLNPRIHVIPNPCVIDCNGIPIAISSFFGIGDMKNNSIMSGVNLINSYCQKILEQANFHPVFPSSDKVPVDRNHIDLMELKVNPALFLMNSDNRLPSFLSETQDCKFVLPGKLLKKKNDKEFLEIGKTIIFPLKESEISFENNISTDRIKTFVEKIEI